MEFSSSFHRSISCVISLYMIFSCYSFVHCEVIPHQTCESSRNCEIVNVSLSPCPEALENEPCKLYRGTNVTWSFNYIPKFSANKLTLQGYGHFLFVDVPYPGQDREGCKFTKCPVVSGKLRHLEYKSPILKYYPAAPFTVKWKLWDESNNECCFTSNIVIS